MKKIILLSLVTLMSANIASANLDSDFWKTCNEVGGKYAVLESYPVQEKCNIDWEMISKASFEDKYNYFVKEIMINYFTEYKYSDASKWTSYNDFLDQDIKDYKIFQKWNFDSKTDEKISEYILIQENLYNFSKLRTEIWETQATLIEEQLSKLESKFPSEKALKNMHIQLQKALKKKIEDLENLQMVAKFTPEGHKNFLFKLNSYRYLKILVDGRLK